MGVLVVASKELFRVNPQTESILRTITVAGVAAFEGKQFLDPTITAVAFQRPASIRSGVCPRAALSCVMLRMTSILETVGQARKRVAVNI